MGKKLYVGNLDYGVDDGALRRMFSPFGNVQTANVINDRYTGQSKGFGFVEMSTNEEAQAAISALDGKEHAGRTLKVNPAKPQEDRRKDGGRGGYGRGGDRRW